MQQTGHTSQVVQPTISKMEEGSCYSTGWAYFRDKIDEKWCAITGIKWEYGGGENANFLGMQ